MGGYSYGKVNFTAVNTNAPKEDSATSTIHTDYYYLPSCNKSFSLQAYYLGLYDDNGEMQFNNFNIDLDEESVIWVGGYNEIEITFHPTDPEEKEATFTMPDGSVLTATAEQPTIFWHTDSLINKGLYLSYGNTSIKAESNFKKGNTQYRNVGYIYLYVNTDLRYNRFDDRWYISYWLKGSPLEEKTYVKLTAENLMISGDSCTSYNGNFKNTIDNNIEIFNLPYYVYDDEPPLGYQFTKDGNEIFVVGNEKILFTFIPAPGEKSMKLELPTGESIILTDAEPTYVWDFPLDYAEKLQGKTRYINANSEYTYNGINYYGQSEIKLLTTTNIFYAPTNGKYYRYSN
ncbi:MAG: hypothetical protein K2I08_09060 [Muribaculaceae bacterium]|nr:hypothetical protein [Muribaculaceae bacterium]